MTIALRAVLLGAWAVLLRLSREGMIIRALAWPGLLSGMAVVGTVLVVTQCGAQPTQAPHVALHADDAALLRAAVRDAGLQVRLDPDPASAVAAGRAERAAWQSDDRWVLQAPRLDLATTRVEALLRDQAQASWRIQVPPDPPRQQAIEEQAGRMASLVAVLFTLYGVVMGAGLAWRDRGEGVVEATLPLPVPAWTHAAARILALGVGMSAGVLGTLQLLHGIFGMEDPLRWMLHGCLASATGAAVGLATVGGSGASRRGFSGPLSRAMAIVAGLLGLGWGLPGVGAFLPIASLSAAGTVATLPSGLSALGLGLLVMAGAAAWWGRHHGGLGR